jgi:co-chaperonin GroES (HSP10)
MNSLPKPRNTLLLVTTLKRGEEKVGDIIMPELNGKDYTLAKVEAVGPGTVVEDGVRSEMHDLKPGQRVFLQTHRDLGGGRRIHEGIEVKHGGKRYVLYEQSNVLTIVDEPGEWEEAESDSSTTSPIIT